jgi:hypothetical protein
MEEELQQAFQQNQAQDASPCASSHAPAPAAIAQDIKANFNLAAVSIQSRLLPFWREIPRAWFIQFEAVVDPLHTSDDQKYRYVLQQLQAADLRHVTDILYNPPATNKYEAIKSRLLAAYDKSEVKNFQQLISGLELGDQKPSQLVRRMRELSGGMITDDGLKIEWLNQLPTQMRVVLSINTTSSLDILAAMADQMAEYSTPANNTIAAIAKSSEETNEATMITKFDALSKQLEKLTLEVAELRAQAPRDNYRRLAHSRFRSRSRSLSTRNTRRETSVKPGDPTWECKYHFRFGDKAKRCESPCSRRIKKSEN